MSDHNKRIGYDPKRIGYDPETGEVRDNDIGLYTNDVIILTNEIQNDALRFLATQGRGVILEQLSSGIKDIIIALQDETATEGTISISLVYRQGTDGEIRCKSKVNVKIPVQESESIYFATMDGSLSRRRPDEKNFIPR